MMCGWCQNTGVYMNKTCVCATKRKPFFPPKPKRKVDDLLPSGHKHDCHSVISSHATHEWWECSCGHVYKITIR